MHPSTIAPSFHPHCNATKPSAFTRNVFLRKEKFRINRRWSCIWSAGVCKWLLCWCNATKRSTFTDIAAEWCRGHCSLGAEQAWIAGERWNPDGARKLFWETLGASASILAAALHLAQPLELGNKEQWRQLKSEMAVAPRISQWLHLALAATFKDTFWNILWGTFYRTPFLTLFWETFYLEHSLTASTFLCVFFWKQFCTRLFLFCSRMDVPGFALVCHGLSWITLVCLSISDHHRAVLNIQTFGEGFKKFQIFVFFASWYFLFVTCLLPGIFACLFAMRRTVRRSLLTTANSLVAICLPF